MDGPYFFLSSTIWPMCIPDRREKSGLSLPSERPGLNIFISEFAPFFGKVTPSGMSAAQCRRAIGSQMTASAAAHVPAAAPRSALFQASRFRFNSSTVCTAEIVGRNVRFRQCGGRSLFQSKCKSGRILGCLHSLYRTMMRRGAVNPIEEVVPMKHKKSACPAVRGHALFFAALQMFCSVLFAIGEGGRMVLSLQHIDLAQQLFLKLGLGIFNIRNKINAITTDPAASRLLCGSSHFLTGYKFFEAVVLRKNPDFLRSTTGLV